MRPEEYSHHSPHRGEGFAIASLTLAILSLFSMCTLLLPLPLSALSLFFAHLSHRRKRPLYSPAVAGILLSCLSLLLALVIATSSWFSLSRMMQDPAQRSTLEQSIESIYGADTPYIMEEMQKLFPSPQP